MVVLGLITWPLLRRGGWSRRGSRWWLAAALTNVVLLTAVAPALHIGAYARLRATPMAPPADESVVYGPWRRACQWIAAHPRQVPPDARFFTPFGSQTFKWYTGRSEVATWKDIPQDARSIVVWWNRIKEIYGTGNPGPNPQWYISPSWALSWRGPAEADRLRKKYNADFVLTERWPVLPLKKVYENEMYVIYQFSSDEVGNAAPSAGRAPANAGDIVVPSVNGEGARR